MLDRVKSLWHRQRTHASYARMFDLHSRDARIVFADLTYVCNFDRTTACVNGAGVMDPIAMAYAEGQRAALLHILRMANTDTTALQSAITQELSEQ